MNKFYVYGYFRKDGTPYYIGKGCNRRAWKFHKVVKPPVDHSRIRILADGLTEEEAFSWEADLISLLGRKDNGTGCLRNLTAGGVGGTRGRICTAATREKMRQANKGRSPGPQSAKHKTKKAEATKKRTMWFHSDFGWEYAAASELAGMHNQPNQFKLYEVKAGRRNHTAGWRIVS